MPALKEDVGPERAYKLVRFGDDQTDDGQQQRGKARISVAERRQAKTKLAADRRREEAMRARDVVRARRAYEAFHQLPVDTSMVEQLEHSLLFKWQGSDTTLAPILFEGHHDVVPIIPGTENLWQENPFAGVISNNRIWGRGALDDKSGVIGLIEAATYLIKSNFKLLILFLEPITPKISFS